MEKVQGVETMYYFLTCENSTSSQVPGEESLAESFSDIPVSVLSRLNLIGEKSCCNGSGTESCQSSQSGMTSEHLMETLGEDESMSCAGGSRAKTSAGKGIGINGERSGLWKQMLRVVCEVRPQHVFVENSPLLTVRGMGTVLGDLAKIGFYSRWTVLGTKHVGGHCEGERLWIVAKTSEGGRSKMVRGIEGINPKEGEGRTSVNAYPCSRIDRIHELEKVVGEPAILGINDGLAYRVDRLEAIGDGQVPAVVKLAWETLSQ